jgi:Mrp family chromosome partitioning ATPase
MTTSCDTCKSTCDAKTPKPGESTKDFELRQQVKKQLCGIKNRILVFSGKGGVGKSTVSAALALGLANRQNRVGLLDIDIHGPSIPVIFDIDNPEIQLTSDNLMIPYSWAENLDIISTGFFVEQNKAVVWRGPMKYSAIRQFMAEVAWGIQDYLIVDSPPGTGDEPLAIVQLLEDVTGVVIVTTPQEIATADVRKCIDFCHTLKIPIIGIVENMSGFNCPHCNKITQIFQKDGGKKLAEEFNLPLLAQIPIDPAVSVSGNYLESLSQETSSLHSYIRPMIDAVAQFAHNHNKTTDR